MTPAEWDALPWWQQRMYVEGLNHEFDSKADSQPGAQQDDNRVIFSGQVGEFAAAGFQETTL